MRARGSLGHSPADMTSLDRQFCAGVYVLIYEVRRPRIWFQQHQVRPKPQKPVRAEQTLGGCRKYNSLPRCAPHKGKPARSYRGTRRSWFGEGGRVCWSGGDPAALLPWSIHRVLAGEPVFRHVMNGGTHLKIMNRHPRPDQPSCLLPLPRCDCGWQLRACHSFRGCSSGTSWRFHDPDRSASNHS